MASHFCQRFSAKRFFQFWMTSTIRNSALIYCHENRIRRGTIAFQKIALHISTGYTRATNSV